MEEKKQNRNALRSKALIRKAFLELIKTKPVSDISVTDIVRLADLNRATFYAHYSCVRAIGDEIEDEIVKKMESILAEFRFDDFFANPTPILLQVSKFLAEDVEYFRTLISVSEANQFMEKLGYILVDYMKKDTTIPPEVKSMKSFPLRICYFAGGICNTYLQWFKGKLDCSIYDIPLEIARMFQDIPPISRP